MGMWRVAFQSTYLLSGPAINNLTAGIDEEDNPIVLRLPKSVEVSLSILARSPIAAAELGHNIVRKLTPPGWEAELTHVRVSPHPVPGRPQAPEVALVGVAEVAKLLRVSRQRVGELARRPEFPRPVSKLGLRPIWEKESILRFASRWTRRPGRPSTKVDERKKPRTR